MNFLKKTEEEKLQAEVEVELYGIVDEFNEKLSKLGKAQAQYAILGLGAYKIIEVCEKVYRKKFKELGKELRMEKKEVPHGRLDSADKYVTTGWNWAVKQFNQKLKELLGGEK